MCVGENKACRWFGKAGDKRTGWIKVLSQQGSYCSFVYCSSSDDWAARERHLTSCREKKAAEWRYMLTRGCEHDPQCVKEWTRLLTLCFAGRDVQVFYTWTFRYFKPIVHHENNLVVMSNTLNKSVIYLIESETKCKTIRMGLDIHVHDIYILSGFHICADVILRNSASRLTKGPEPIRS